ncbi:unnamed protein product, partial [Hapterophycus canaliculatus]
CPCTCSDGSLNSCIDNDFDDCAYPQCDPASTSDEAACSDLVRDGYCDSTENNLSCGFDGGDVSFCYVIYACFPCVGAVNAGVPII